MRRMRVRSTAKFSREEIKAVWNLIDRRLGRGFAKNNVDLVTALLNVQRTGTRGDHAAGTDQEGKAGRVAAVPTPPRGSLGNPCS